MEARRKKAQDVEEAGGDDSFAVVTGRAKRSRAAENPRYGTENGAISGSLELSRGGLKDATHALATLQYLGYLEKEKREKERQEKALVLPDVCQCEHDLKEKLRGGTLEDAVEIDDDDDDDGGGGGGDDDDLEVLAITPRPLLPKYQPRIDCDRATLIDGANLTADDISGHQRNLAIGFEGEPEGARRSPAEAPVDEAQTDKESCMSTDEDLLITTVNRNLKETKSALKRLKTKKPVRAAVKGARVAENSTSGTGRRGRNVDDEEGEDDLDDPMFASPRHKKSRDVKYAESDEDGPDYEVHVDSDSDREPTPEVEDPFDDIWKECAVMSRQSKLQDDDEGDEGRCEHTYEIQNDVGKACSKCGLIKEDIKDMSFVWRKPATLRKAWTRGERVHTCDGDGDGVLEEEARLVGMPPLEAHGYLEGAMHPHQLEGFKFLSKNLVEEDSGGCMLAFAPGTGKSFLVISFIHSFMIQVPNARPMIVAPKSMLRPWTQEFKKWQVEDTKVFNLYDANGDPQLQVEMLKQWQETRSVLLVGYATCTNMSGEVGRYLTEGPGLLVLDEGHLARTESTKILKSLSRVHTRRRVLLSGTPFNNNFEEFYTTLELIRPNFMLKANAQMETTLNTLIAPEPKPSGKISPLLKRSSNAGRQAFKDVIGEKFESGKHDNIARALQQLRRLIEPFVAWHKGQILETLPGITDLTIMLELSLQQREVLKNDKSEVKDNLQKRAAAIYVHPMLAEVAENGKRTQNDPRLKADNIDLKLGVKLRWVLDLVQLCDDAKEKVLIFSEYLYVLALIENVAMHKMKWSRGSQILRLDGGMLVGDRERVINKFNTDPEAKMLCASVKACGEGISLVGASRVVMMEVVWNPSVTRQAISRAFRIGQQKKVVVYRLIAADTYEERRMHATATRKEWLSKLLFDPTISCDDPNSILWDVTGTCTDQFLSHGALRTDVKSIWEREF